MKSKPLGPPVCGRRIPALSGRLLVVIIFLVPLAGCLDPGTPGDDAAPPTPADPTLVLFYDGLAADPVVHFRTDLGDIEHLVYESLMPQTAGRFLELVDSGFHDGTIIHRVVDEFVIQGGDPSGTGLLGSGQTIPLETHPELPFSHGSMGLARDLDPDSGDSQWFITEKPQPHLTAPSGATGSVFGTYAMYAQVHTGMDVVRQIAGVATVPGADRPVTDIHLLAATVQPPPPIDLLELPHAVTSQAGATYTLDIVRPLHTFTNRPFPLTVFVERSDDAQSLPDVVIATLQQGDTMHSLRLEPHAEDPAVYRTETTLDAAGNWTLSASADDDAATDTLRVHPWHPDYARYDRRP